MVILLEQKDQDAGKSGASNFVVVSAYFCKKILIF